MNEYIFYFIFLCLLFEILLLSDGAKLLIRGVVQDAAYAEARINFSGIKKRIKSSPFFFKIHWKCSYLSSTCKHELSISHQREGSALEFTNTKRRLQIKAQILWLRLFGVPPITSILSSNCKCKSFEALYSGKDNLKAWSTS